MRQVSPSLTCRQRALYPREQVGVKLERRLLLLVSCGCLSFGLGLVALVPDNLGHHDSVEKRA